MTERWVCKRCFSANEETASACAKCGLGRGSEIPSDDAWAPAASEERPSRLGGLLRFWWVPVLAISVGSAWLFSADRDDSGGITGAGDLQATELRAGDCFELQDPEEEVIDDVRAKPCSETHEFEMFFVGSMPDGEFPSGDAMDQYIFDNCIPAFGEYVGLSYQESVLEIYPLVPTEEGWNDGDHTIQCAAFDPGDDQLTGSLRDSGR